MQSVCRTHSQHQLLILSHVSNFQMWGASGRVIQFLLCFIPCIHSVLIPWIILSDFMTLNSINMLVTPNSRFI